MRAERDAVEPKGRNAARARPTLEAVSRRKRAMSPGMNTANAIPRLSSTRL